MERYSDAVSVRVGRKRKGGGRERMRGGEG